MRSEMMDRIRGELKCWSNTQYEVLNDAAKHGLTVLKELELVYQWLQVIEAKSSDIEVKYLTRLARDGAPIPETKQ